jgi:hypothetical protein
MMYVRCSSFDWSSAGRTENRNGSEFSMLAAVRNERPRARVLVNDSLLPPVAVGPSSG